MRATILRRALPMALIALTACHGTQPTIEQTNEATNAQLGAINAALSNTDGMDQGNAELMAVPSAGQTMDAKEQPPKSQ